MSAFSRRAFLQFYSGGRSVLLLCTFQCTSQGSFNPSSFQPIFHFWRSIPFRCGSDASSKFLSMHVSLIFSYIAYIFECASHRFDAFCASSFVNACCAGFVIHFAIGSCSCAAGNQARRPGGQPAKRRSVYLYLCRPCVRVRERESSTQFDRGRAQERKLELKCLT